MSKWHDYRLKNFCPLGENNIVLLPLVFLLIIIVIQAEAFCFCCIFWRKKKLRGKGLQKFLEKRVGTRESAHILWFHLVQSSQLDTDLGLTSTPPSEMQRSLQSKKRGLGKMISELEQQAAEDAASNETLGELGEMVRAKEGVERKLYASYSLGRDRLGLKQGSPILPLYHGKYKSHSFHSSPNESIHVFNIPSDTSTSSSSDDSESCSSTSSGDTDIDARLQSVEEAGPSNTANIAERVQEECLSDVGSPFHVFTNPSFVEEQRTGSTGNVLSQKEERMETVNDFIFIKRLSLKRRRTSSTNWSTLTKPYMMAMLITTWNSM